MLLVLIIGFASKSLAEEKLMLCSEKGASGMHPAFPQRTNGYKVFARLTDGFFSGKKIDYRVGLGEWKRWCHNEVHGRGTKQYNEFAAPVEFIGNTVVCKTTSKYERVSNWWDTYLVDPGGNMQKPWYLSEKNFKLHAKHGPWRFEVETISYLNFSRLYQVYLNLSS